MTVYPVQVSPDGIDVAIRNNDPDTIADIAQWRTTGGIELFDSQVTNWTPYAPASELDTTDENATALHDVVMHHLRQGFLNDEPAVRALAEWQAKWPPTKENDVDLTGLPAILDQLDATGLEQAAVALSNLSATCWELRRSKLTAERRKMWGNSTARVTLYKGHLAESSTVTIDGAVGTIPTSLERTGALFAPRVEAVIDALGYRLTKGMKIVAESDPMALKWIEYDVIRKTASDG